MVLKEEIERVSEAWNIRDSNPQTRWKMTEHGKIRAAVIIPSPDRYFVQKQHEAA